MEKLECPVCGKKMLSLVTHLMYKHGYTKDKIKKEFKDKGIPLHIDKRKKGSHKCDVCGKMFEYKNVLQSHIKILHPKYFIGPDKSKEGELECVICGKKTNNLFCHIKTFHEMEWEEYIDKHDPDGQKVAFTDEHKKSLSVNKKRFYQSERGLELKDEQSEMYSGDKNPARRPSVRKKISESAIKRIKNNSNNFTVYTWGINISFDFDNKRYHTRSFQEFKVLYILLVNNIQFEYEKSSFTYINEDGNIKSYLLDLQIGDKLIEIKPGKYDIKKYELISDAISKIGKKLEIMNYEKICKSFNIKKKNERYFTDMLYKMTQNNQCKISQVVNNRTIKLRVISKIDEDYMNNPNIKIITINGGKVKNEND